MAIEKLHVNYQFVMRKIEDQISGNPDSRILDYGCGRGEIIQWGREKGIEVFGADTFERGIEQRVLPENRELLDVYIRQIKKGCTGFEDDYFDLVVSNQVFEHVKDMDAVLKEIRRVLKPGGKLVALFPSKEVIREGHIGIPFSHWFPKGSRTRFYYTFFLRSLGFGSGKSVEGLPAGEWTRRRLKFIDTRTFYLPKKEIYALLDKYFIWEHQESDYIRFRAGKIKNAFGGFFSKTKQRRISGRVGAVAFRYLAGFVISAQKPA